MEIKNSKGPATIFVRSFNFTLHTASDGQKILNKKNSLNAAFSYKYPGFDKASVANTAVDERFAMFYATVIVASAREAVSMVDMHLNNPVIKSTIHSTDTHGSTEVVFGMMHLLGVFFAPRINDLGSQQLYGFKSKKEYEVLIVNRQKIAVWCLSKKVAKNKKHKTLIINEL